MTVQFRGTEGTAQKWRTRWKPRVCPNCGKEGAPGGMSSHIKWCGEEYAHIDRFWEKVAEGKPDECWLWRGAVTTHGYGCVQWDGRVLGAHKVAYLITNGEVPAGLQVRHACHNPLCCNPDHLSVGTRKDNAQDSVKAGRRPKRHIVKLDAAAVQHIRDSKGKLSSGELAEKYGVCQSHIFAVWAGRSGKRFPARPATGEMQ